MRPGRSAALVAVVMVVGLFGVAGAAPIGTDCGFGGPTPGWQVIRFDLPEGSEFLTLELGGQRTPRPVNDDQNWHLAQGIFVVRADTLEIEAYRIDSQGMAPRRAVLRAEGVATVNQPVAAPDVPYVHHASRLRTGLPPGSYLVIAFGSDGGPALQNEWWSAGIQVSGHYKCAPLGTGETFDYDHTDFAGGTQISAPGVGYADSISHEFANPRQLVAGLIDAETQARTASSVSLDYQTPTAEGTVSQKLIPFVSTAGKYRFEASFQGVYPVIVVAGVGVDLS